MDSIRSKEQEVRDKLSSHDEAIQKMVQEIDRTQRSIKIGDDQKKQMFEEMMENNKKLAKVSTQFMKIP